MSNSVKKVGVSENRKRRGGSGDTVDMDEGWLRRRGRKVFVKESGVVLTVVKISMSD